MRLLEASTLVKGSLLTAVVLPSVVLGSEVSLSESQAAPLLRRHTHHHHRKHVSPRTKNVEPVAAPVQKRSGQSCKFPDKNKMVAVASSQMNGGWALPPDQPCQPGMYCPYACPPGYLMGQWDPDAVTYTYPQSMNGGLLCDNDGEVSIPFPEKEFCYPGAGTFLANNLLSEPVAICQTVLPGREDMLIPTLVQSNGFATLAVPGPEYWCATAAHYYINPPGVSVEEGCIWGSTAHPRGNWAPYVAGANIDDNGNTFTKIGWNPIYLEPTTPFRDERPDWGLKIICAEGGQCNGLPCMIDPAIDDVNGVNGDGGSSTNGAGGANFCVVTAPKGSKAILVTFPAGKGDDDSAAVPVGEVDITTSDPGTTTPDPTTTTSEEGTTTTSEELTTTDEPPTTTTSEEPTSTSTPPTSTSTSSTESSTSIPTTTSESSTSISESSTEASTSTSVESSTSTTSVVLSYVAHAYNTTSSKPYTPTLTPINQGVVNATADASLFTNGASSTDVAQPSPSQTKEGAASAVAPSIFALAVVAIAHAVFAL
ncbi:hypothetical protein TWF481_008653 [Arthrobotrys musiformis]|uniref:Uncharacterized protein n=1 Tax=Arthrobotrys musiformis TaxID=47236 RepID=A0AAV9W9T2_9PEZI